MIYTIIQADDELHIARAELNCREDFDDLIEKLVEYRNDHYPQKEEQNKQP